MLIQRVIDSYQVVTELDDEGKFESAIKMWSRLGYKLHGDLKVAVAEVKRKDEYGGPYDAIVYTQVMVKFKWRWDS